MIVYLKNHEIDREQWDNCIRNSGIAKPYPYSWFLDIVSPGWEALVDDEYDSVFPVPSKKRLNIQYISTPAFLQQLGAFSPDKPATSVIYKFLSYLPDFYKYVDLNIGQKVEHDGLKVTEKFNYVIDLSRTYDSIYNSFTPECKRKVDSAAKKEIHLAEDIKPDEVIDLFLLSNTSPFKSIKPFDYKRLKNLMDFCLVNKKGKILGVRSGRKKLIYGLFFIQIPGSLTIISDAHTLQSREKRIGYFLVNELIKKHSSTKTLLDFAGSVTPESLPFVESFGARKKPYYRIYRKRLFWPGWMFR
jgi:hypothetical protein